MKITQRAGGPFAGKRLGAPACRALQMENRYEARPGIPLFDHLFHFRSEADALRRLPAFNAGNGWNTSIVFPDIKIVLSRTPHRTLSGFRVLVSQTEPRLELWEEFNPELEAIADRNKADGVSNFHVKVRAGCAQYFALMEPVPAGSRYPDYRRPYSALAALNEIPRRLDAVEFNSQISELVASIEHLKELLTAKARQDNALNFENELRDLDLLLALLQARFVNINAMERLINTVVASIATKFHDKITDKAIDLATTALLLKGLELIVKGWGGQ